ncbi:MAG: xanthine dehydrogenase small subunit [Rubrivivax sp.]
MSERPIRFVHRGRVVEVDGLPITTTVLAWLRERARLTGTKEGCNEGDCGACTVMVGELVADRLRWRTVNACLMFLPALDGKALRTVEDLGPQHPAAEAMVRCHGSQCGFCTPGFVVSLAACHETHRAAGSVPTRQQLADALSGNLCRCTGYRPILDAGEAMAALPFEAPDPGPTEALLRRLAADPPLHLQHAGQTFDAPRSLRALADLAAAKPEATLLAGSTDIGLWSNKQFRPLPALIHVGAVPELKTVDEADGHLRIGAGVPLEDAWQALATHWPELREMHLRFASPPVRHAGTLGGNVANGSPIGDAPPVLLALGARLVLRLGADERTLPLDGFYLGYMQNQRRPGEVLVRIEVPRPAPGWRLRAWKLSKRWDCDISGLSAGLALRLEGDRVAEARWAFGGLAATCQRARAAEAAVTGRPWTEATARAAQDALAQDFQPLSDLRGSAAYRLRSARALVQRLWLETRPDHPLPASATRVREVTA